jgi:hypothetical protein
MLHWSPEGQMSTAEYLEVEKKLRGLSPRANYTDRLPPVGEVSANVCSQRGVAWSA